MATGARTDVTVTRPLAFPWASFAPPFFDEAFLLLKGLAAGALRTTPAGAFFDAAIGFFLAEVCGVTCTLAPSTSPSDSSATQALPKTIYGTPCDPDRLDAPATFAGSGFARR